MIGLRRLLLLFKVDQRFLCLADFSRNKIAGLVEVSEEGFFRVLEREGRLVALGLLHGDFFDDAIHSLQLLLAVVSQVLGNCFGVPLDVLDVRDFRRAVRGRLVVGLLLYGCVNVADVREFGRKKQTVVLLGVLLLPVPLFQLLSFLGSS